MIKMTLIYISVMSLVAFFAFGLDKYKAKAGKGRIPERTLFLLTFLGGGIGSFLGMKFFHHKTMHKQFVIGIPAIMVLQILLLGLLIWRMTV